MRKRQDTNSKKNKEKLESEVFADEIFIYETMIRRKAI